MKMRSFRLPGTSVKLASNFGRDTSGATAVEYALMAAGVALVIAALIFVIGADISEPYQTVSDGLNN